MARPAPAAARALAVLDFLMAHPAERFTLADLARRTGINGASAHAVMAVLQDKGYVLRHPTQKTYSLGTAVVAGGLAALEQLPAVRHAIDEAYRLSEAVGLEVFATAQAGEDEIVCVARAGRSSADAETMYVGQRMPLVPPLGSVFVAWGPPGLAERWLARSVDRSPEDEARLMRDLASVRERGYAIGLAAHWHHDLNRAISAVADEPARPDLRHTLDALIAEIGRDPYQLTDLGDDERYVLRSIVVPIFDSTSAVAAALSVSAGQRPLGRAEILEIVRQARDAAATATRLALGKPLSTSEGRSP